MDMGMGRGLILKVGICTGVTLPVPRSSLFSDDYASGLHIIECNHDAFIQIINVENLKGHRSRHSTVLKCLKNGT